MRGASFRPPEGFDKRLDDGRVKHKYGRLFETEYYSETTGNKRKCYVYTPPCYDSSKTCPVLYLLHGIGGTHTEWLSGAPNEILSNLIAAGETPPMIAVMPNVRAARDDALPPDIFSDGSIAAFDNFINDLKSGLMPFIEANYPVSKKRVETALAGLSMGGREALFIGLKMPETFGYIGAFSPAPGLLPFSGLDPRRVKVEYPGQLTGDEMTLPSEFKENTFIMINNGNQDETVNDIPFIYHKALEDNGIRHIYYTVDGGHDFGVWKNGLYYFARSIFK